MEDGRVLALLAILGVFSARKATGSRGVARSGSRPALPTTRQDEVVIPLVNGNDIRCNAHPEPLTIVRVTDGAGNELERLDVETLAIAYLAPSVLHNWWRAAESRRVSFPAGKEAAIRIRGGGMLRCDASPDPITYIRVVSPQGKEVGYWTIDEITEDPSDVMGAILGAARGVVGSRGVSAEGSRGIARSGRMPDFPPRILRPMLDRIGGVTVLTPKKNTLWKPASALSRGRGEPQLVDFNPRSFYQTNNDVTEAFYKLQGYPMKLVAWFDNPTGRRIA